MVPVSPATRRAEKKGSEMPYLRDSEVETAPLQNETILLRPSSNKFCLLNQTASFIWNEVGTPKSAEDIADQLVTAFTDVGLQEAISDVKATLEQLSSMGFVVAGANERESKNNVPVKKPSEPAKYERPTLRSLNEEEILSAFQVVQAGGSGWWVM